MLHMLYHCGLHFSSPADFYLSLSNNREHAANQVKAQKPATKATKVKALH